MPDNFEAAIAVVLPHEGGFVDDKDDPGGVTNFGISLYFLKANGDIQHDDLNHDGRIDIEDIKALTPETAKEYYRRNWWDKYGYGNISNCKIATKIFDIAVNIGGVTANKIAQIAASQCGQLCAADGVLGHVSFNAICNADPNCFITHFEALVASHYRQIVIAHPNLAKYLKGWLNRAYS